MAYHNHQYSGTGYIDNDKYALTAEEQERLLSKIEANLNDMDSIHTVAIANYALLYKPAKKYAICGIEKDDLLSEGYIALTRAVQKYDPGRGCRFSTYAVRAIENQMLKYLSDNISLIRLPRNVQQEIFQQKRIIAEFGNNYGRTPDAAEIAEYVGYSEDEARRIASVAPEVVCYDAPLGEDGEGTLWDTVADNGQSVEEQVMDAVLIGALHNEIAKLSERERDILESRYGLKDGTEHSAEELGRKYNLSCRGIDYIDRNARTSLYRGLRGYYAA